MEKSFLGRPLYLLCLAAAQKIAHAAHSLSRSGELLVKAGYAGSPVSRGTLPPCKQALTDHDFSADARFSKLRPAFILSV